ncbi:MAG: ArsB/NhaD family transporter [Deltaproteobacteria bacterium]|nr:ArsB/NhaD family transporter [Deltaproteobacteria bacterium]
MCSSCRTPLPWLLAGLSLGLASLCAPDTARAQEVPPVVLVGRAVNAQRMPIDGLQARLLADGEPIGQTCRTRADGWFVIELPGDAPLSGKLSLQLQRRHFESRTLEIDEASLRALRSGRAASLGYVTVARRRTAAFWITLLVFVFMMVLVGITAVHNALAALLGASALLATSALGHLFNPDLIVYGFGEAISSIDWNVVFLIMGMMIVIAVVEGTGVFRWLAFFAYKASGGKIWKLMLILMVLTAVSSAVLDNVTTMLLVAPITIRIALAMRIDPLTLLMPEVLAANAGGLSTMVGTPTNILIASYSGISFSDFLLNLTPGVLLALAGIAAYCLLRYRKHFAAAGAMSDELYERLKQGAVIAQPAHLKKAGWVGLGMLLLFILGELLHLPPAVIALMGATCLLAWIRPDIEEMIEAVDWTTLVFFITLFMVVGALQEVGLIDLLAQGVSYLVGSNRILAMLVLTWMAALISTVIPNIPFTATMLPVVGFLTASIPDADPQSLYFCLAVGSAMGGNGSLIGASANLVTAGIAERAGHPITFGHFFKLGFPALLVSVALAFAWLLIRYLAF